MNLHEAVSAAHEQLLECWADGASTPRAVAGVFIERETYYKLKIEPGASPFALTADGAETFMGYPLFLVQDRGTPVSQLVRVVFE